MKFLNTIPIAPGSLFFHTKSLYQTYLKIKQIFNKFRLSILLFIRWAQNNYLKIEPHYFLTIVLWPIFIIITTIKYIYLRRSVNNSFQVSIISCLVHIRHILVHKWRMVNILNSILYVLYQETRKINLSLLKWFPFKFSNKIITQVNILQRICSRWNNCSARHKWNTMFHFYWNNFHWFWIFGEDHKAVW